ncbi:hypothetical protein ULF88_13245 [Halopseudomonas pachastrellae]|nr:hypothetical protein [Halopseudomonas pachastrellae]
MADSTDQAYSVSRLHVDEIRGEHVDQVQSLLRKVPGMNVSTLGCRACGQYFAARLWRRWPRRDIGFVVDGIRSTRPCRTPMVMAT